MILGTSIIKHFNATDLHVFHDEILFSLKVKHLLEHDDVGMGDGGEDGNLALDHVLLALTLGLKNISYIASILQFMGDQDMR